MVRMIQHSSRCLKESIGKTKELGVVMTYFQYVCVVPLDLWKISGTGKIIPSLVIWCLDSAFENYRFPMISY